jgi:hypothetical protein
MSEQVEPFAISAHLPKIILRGDLDDSSDVLSKCRRALENVPKFSRLTIEADSTRVAPDGVTIWIQAVEQFLMGCDLIYAPSQLALILQYDSRYPHPKSLFQEYGVVSVNVSAAGAR